MGPVVVTCEGCGVRIRIARPREARSRACPRCEAPLQVAIDLAILTAVAAGADVAAGGDVEAGGDLGAVAGAVGDARPDPNSIPVAIPTAIGPDAAPKGRGVLVQAILSGLLLVAALTYGLASWRTPASTSIPVVDSRPIPDRVNRPSLPPSDFPRPRTEPVVEPEGPMAPPLASEPPEEQLEAMPTFATPDDPTLVGPMPPPLPSPSPGPEPATMAPTPAGPTEGPGRILVRDEANRFVVTRVYAEIGGDLAVMLPDGQIGWPERRAFTDRPFQPDSTDQLRSALGDGPYRDFKTLQSDHYLIFYRCTEPFAAKSARLLESLYKGLSAQFREWGLDPHESEFPMVAVIYDTERAFRRANKVAPDVQAFYHTLSNRIFCYETADREQESPEVSAIRKPQTIAHEGTHQILSNIGVQPRLAGWPIWLVEGLAEFCAPTFTRKGAEWAGIGRVNPLHMATINDLKEQSALQRSRGESAADIEIGYDFNRPFIEYLVTRTELTPTDYALAWALTHYLALEKADDFHAFLRTMSRMAPGEVPSPADQLAAFREAFGADTIRTDPAVGRHLAGLRYDPLPYYAVVFEQPVGQGAIRKAALVSQSPSMIRQWLESIPAPGGLPYSWRAYPYPTRTRALIAADQWIGQR